HDPTLGQAPMDSHNGLQVAYGTNLKIRRSRFSMKPPTANTRTGGAVLLGDTVHGTMFSIQSSLDDYWSGECMNFQPASGTVRNVTCAYNAGVSANQTEDVIFLGPTQIDVKNLVAQSPYVDSGATPPTGSNNN